MSDAQTQENLNYLRIVDLQRDLANLKVRHDAMEDFIKSQYPMHFAGEVGTIADPDLSPVNLDTTTPERADPATCKHVASTRKYPAWDESKEGIDYCDACGAIIQPQRKSDAPR